MGDKWLRFRGAWYKISPYVIFSCIFVLIRVHAKLPEFHDVFNSFHTAMEWKVKKKVVESLVAEHVFWLLARDDQYFVQTCVSRIHSVSRIRFFLLYCLCTTRVQHA